jgi:glycosyltransferase involved in cell wall biosynthesis
MFPRIRFFGVDSPTGVGTHCSQTVKALQAFQFEAIQVQLVKHNYIDEVQAAVSDSMDSDVNIFFFPEVYANNLKGTKIYWCVFDASRPNPGYEQWLESFHYVFATSHWGRDILLERGMDGSKIFVVPEGVDPKFYNPYGRPTAAPGGKTKFLMVGKYEQKKGYREAFEALRIAVAQGANLELLTKSDWINGTNAVLHPEFIQLVQQYQSQFNIVVYNGNFSREQMRTLYYSADYFLHPSRCEGWSLPLIEAIACGVPCISTRFGGHSEYLGFLAEEDTIQTTLAPVDCQAFKDAVGHSDGDYGQWAYPNVEDMAQRILAAAAALPGASGLVGSDYVRQHYCWDRTADKILQFLQALGPTASRTLAARAS